MATRVKLGKRKKKGKNGGKGKGKTKGGEKGKTKGTESEAAKASDSKGTWSTPWLEENIEEPKGKGKTPKTVSAWSELVVTPKSFHQIGDVSKSIESRDHARLSPKKTASQ